MYESKKEGVSGAVSSYGGSYGGRMCGADGNGGTKTAAGNYDEPMTFDFYDVAANYQGTQAGWFAKVVKDKFNIELNMISPQVAGNGIYQTRCSTGNLGDIVVLERTDFCRLCKSRIN